MKKIFRNWNLEDLYQEFEEKLTKDDIITDEKKIFLRIENEKMKDDEEEEEEEEIELPKEKEVYVFGPSGCGKSRLVLEYGLYCDMYMIYIVCDYNGMNPDEEVDKSFKNLYSNYIHVSSMKKVNFGTNTERAREETWKFLLGKLCYLLFLKRWKNDLTPKEFLICQFGENNQEIMKSFLSEFQERFNDTTGVKGLIEKELKKFEINKDKEVGLCLDEVNQLFKTDGMFCKSGDLKRGKPFAYPFINVAAEIDFAKYIYSGTMMEVQWKERIPSCTGKDFSRKFVFIELNNLFSTSQEINNYVSQFLSYEGEYDFEEKLPIRKRFGDRIVKKAFVESNKFGSFEDLVEETYEIYKDKISTDCINKAESAKLRMILLILNSKFQDSRVILPFQFKLKDDIDILPCGIAYLWEIKKKVNAWIISEEIVKSALKEMKFEKNDSFRINFDDLNDPLRFVVQALMNKFSDRGKSFEGLFSKLFFEHCNLKSLSSIFPLSNFNFHTFDSQTGKPFEGWGDLGDIEICLINGKLADGGLSKCMINKRLYSPHNEMHPDILYYIPEKKLLIFFALKSSKTSVAKSERKKNVKSSSLVLIWKQFLNPLQSTSLKSLQDDIRLLKKQKLNGLIRVHVEVKGKWKDLGLKEKHMSCVHQSFDNNTTGFFMEKEDFEDNFYEKLIWVDEDNIEYLIGVENLFYIQFMSEVMEFDYSHLEKLKSDIGKLMDIPVERFVYIPSAAFVKMVEESGDKMDVDNNSDTIKSVEKIKLSKEYESLSDMERDFKSSHSYLRQSGIFKFYDVETKALIQKIQNESEILAFPSDEKYSSFMDKVFQWITNEKEKAKMDISPKRDKIIIKFWYVRKGEKDEIIWDVNKTKLVNIASLNSIEEIFRMIDLSSSDHSLHEIEDGIKINDLDVALDSKEIAVLKKDVFKRKRGDDNLINLWRDIIVKKPKRVKEDEDEPKEIKLCIKRQNQADLQIIVSSMKTFTQVLVDIREPSGFGLFYEDDFEVDYDMKVGGSNKIKGELLIVVLKKKEDEDEEMDDYITLYFDDKDDDQVEIKIRKNEMKFDLLGEKIGKILELDSVDQVIKIKKGGTVIKRDSQVKILTDKDKLTVEYVLSQMNDDDGEK